MIDAIKSPKEVIDDWINAYNTRDPYALIELYHDDAVNHQVAFGSPIQGREAFGGDHAARAAGL